MYVKIITIQKNLSTKQKMYMSRPIKVTLNSIASLQLKQTAQELQIPEGEVLRKALAIMRCYSQAQKQDPVASLMLRSGDTVRELVFR